MTISMKIAVSRNLTCPRNISNNLLVYNGGISKSRIGYPNEKKDVDVVEHTLYPRPCKI